MVRQGSEKNFERLLTALTSMSLFDDRAFMMRGIRQAGTCTFKETEPQPNPTIAAAWAATAVATPLPVATTVIAQRTPLTTLHPIPMRGWPYSGTPPS